MVRSADAVCGTTVNNFFNGHGRIGQSAAWHITGPHSQERILIGTDAHSAHDSGICQACGACCAHSRAWPRFTLESDAEIAAIPAAMIDDNQAAMRCENDRCAALVGDIGVATSCAIYSVRPIVCRDCLPGDDACTVARRARGMPAIDRCR